MLLEISIGINPIIFQYKSLIISWHGFFTMVGVLVSVLLVARWAKKENISSDIVYSVAIWGVLGGIIGARLVHVIDRWDYYSQNFGQIFTLWEGGIAIYGGILGGFLAGGLYAVLCKYPVRKLMDLTAPAVLISMAIGRLGDIINGEHCAAATSSPVSISYVHASSNAANCANGLGVAVHPVILYEMCWYLAVFVIIWKLRNRLAPHGILFVLFLSLYALGRFFITFYRDDRIWGLSLQEAHFISLIILFSSLTWMIYKIRWTSANDSES